MYYDVKVDFPSSVAPSQVVDPGFYDDDNFQVMFILKMTNVYTEEDHVYTETLTLKIGVLRQ